MELLEIVLLAPAIHGGNVITGLNAKRDCCPIFASAVIYQAAFHWILKQQTHAKITVFIGYGPAMRNSGVETNSSSLR
jgi:hypothetical protein